MRSKAHVFQGHPLHPMLIPFPIAFMFGAMVSDVVSMASGSAAWYFVGYVLTVGGFSLALVAAAPGLVDYFLVVRPRAEARRVGTIHLVLNVAIAGLYVASWLIKSNLGHANWGSLVLEVAGCLGLLVSGWLGWHLVYHHRIGVKESEAPDNVARLQRKVG